MHLAEPAGFSRRDLNLLQNPQALAELPVVMANNPPAKVREVAVPRVADVTSSIVKPTIEGHFELKHPMIQLLHSSGQFTGMSHEDPQRHIHTFLQIVDTFSIGRVTKEYVQLTMFPFSLLGNASNWLLAEPANFITSWDDLATKFLTRFFPPAKTARLQREIMSFRQKSGENLYQAWERFKGLLRDCLHHHQTNKVLAHTFIESLDAQHKSSLDTGAGGFTQSTPDWQDDAASSSVREALGVFEVDNFTTLSAQIDAMHTEIKKLAVAQAPPHMHVVQQAIVFCDVYGEGHNGDECPTNPASIYFMGNAGNGQGNKNQYGNSYNPNWRNHLISGGVTTQIVSAQNTRPPGGLPSDTDVNPKPCNAVTLRNGRELEEVAPKKTSRVEAEKENITEEMIKEERVVKTPVAKQPQPVVAKTPVAKQPQPVVVKPPPPFPQRLGIPKYAKHINDIVANKSRFTELPTKLKDPGSFTIEISIGKLVVARALCDLGASINLMPSSIFRKLGLGVPSPTTIVLQLADRSLARLEGIIEDVLVQVGSLIIPANFMILDFDPDPEVPFILGRPFLATGRALIDVAVGQLTMRVHDKVEVFNVYHALKMPAIYELSIVTILNDDTGRPLITSHDPLERDLMGDDIFGDSATFEMVQILDMASIYICAGEFEPLDRNVRITPKLSIEEPPNLELKPLSAHLKYAFLGEGDTLPMILAAELTAEEVSICLEVLKSYKRALG
ncbi:uncharacterized protein LOC132612136 [Lycium barbarum]|uniref:uncharacterized protein LOC132612136 n=1 Tax=Lycium barbarum TaxID=112863 RepID=UPI00293E0D76|nr:uncharacterized protein LOC132612136 [Lycium barbarum]